MNKPQVYVIHGYLASPSDHWFPWLKKTMEEKQVSVEVLALPDSSAPVSGAWHQTLMEGIEVLDENTYLIAHSLGCATLLRYLEAALGKKSIGGIILVSGFVSSMSSRPQFDAFVDRVFDFNKVIDATPQRAVIASRQDDIVPYDYSEQLAMSLDASLHSIDGAGHFLGSDGYDEFPQLLDVLQTMIST